MLARLIASLTCHSVCPRHLAPRSWRFRPSNRRRYSLRHHSLSLDIQDPRPNATRVGVLLGRCAWSPETAQPDRSSRCEGEPQATQVHPHRSRWTGILYRSRATVLAAALAVTPCHPDRRKADHESHRTTQAATFNLFTHVIAPSHHDWRHQAAASTGEGLLPQPRRSGATRLLASPWPLPTIPRPQVRR